MSEYKNIERAAKLKRIDAQINIDSWNGKINRDLSEYRKYLKPDDGYMGGS